MAAMLEKWNNKRYLHKNDFFFQRKTILLFHSYNMAAMNTLYPSPSSIVFLSVIRNPSSTPSDPNSIVPKKICSNPSSHFTPSGPYS